MVRCRAVHPTQHARGPSYIVFSSPVDVRNIISDDDALQEGILPSLRQYNIEQFTTVGVPGTEHQVRMSCIVYLRLGTDEE
jgi:hypothetical protein